MQIKTKKKTKLKGQPVAANTVLTVGKDISQPLAALWIESGRAVEYVEKSKAE